MGPWPIPHDRGSIKFYDTIMAEPEKLEYLLRFLRGVRDPQDPSPESALYKSTIRRQQQLMKLWLGHRLFGVTGQGHIGLRSGKS